MLQGRWAEYQGVWCVCVWAVGLRTNIPWPGAGEPEVWLGGEGLVLAEEKEEMKKIGKLRMNNMKHNQNNHHTSETITATTITIQPFAFLSLRLFLLDTRLSDSP